MVRARLRLVSPSACQGKGGARPGRLCGFKRHICVIHFTCPAASVVLYFSCIHLASSSRHLGHCVQGYVTTRFSVYSQRVLCQYQGWKIEETPCIGPAALGHPKKVQKRSPVSAASHGCAFRLDQTSRVDGWPSIPAPVCM